MSRPPDPLARLDLLRAAEAVFIERGLDDAKVEEIAARAGRGKGSFYLHFASKEEAFQQIVVGFLAKVADILEEAMRDTVGLDPRAQAEAWLEIDVRLFEHIWENRGVMRLVLGGGGSAHFGYLIDQFAEQCRRMTVAMMREGARRGLYRRDLDVELAATAIAGAYDRVARELVQREKKPPLRAWMSEMQQFLQRGVMAPEVLEMIDPPVTNRGNRTPVQGIQRAAARRARRRTSR